tara:strand:+ start:44 stop:433 length:390 start_codon:yes stop_codon:yes gene_type:complete
MKQIATFLAPNKGVSFLGEHAFAYSGLLDSGASDAEVTFLDFQTGKEYIVGRIQCFYSTDTVQSSDMIYRIKLNGQIVSQYIDVEDIRMAGDPHQFIPIIIPPNTHVEVTIASIAGAQQQSVMFTGRVY